MIFRLEYCNSNGDNVRVDIKTPVGSEVQPVEGTENPFALKYKGEKSDKSGYFITSSAEINIYETPSFNIDTLKTSNETQIKVDYYVNEVKEWTGFVIPDFFSREIGGSGVVSMTASDRISTLKGVTLSDLPARISIRNLALLCLGKTGLDLPLKTMADFTTQGVTGFNEYFRSEILTQRFSDTKGRSISCYDILRSILVASFSTLVQRHGEWYIVNKMQHEIGAGRLYSSENQSSTWVSPIHNFSEITKGAMRSIIPVAASVGIFHEFGGGRLHPENYDFSQDLSGWTPVGGFSASTINKPVTGYKVSGSGIYEPEYGDETENRYLVNNNPYIRNDNPVYLQSQAIDIPYQGSGAILVEIDINGVGPKVYPNATECSLTVAIVAIKGSEVLTLDHGGKFVPMPSTNPPVFSKSFERGFVLPDMKAAMDTKSMKISGTLEVNGLQDYKIHIRIYGNGSGRTILFNFASIRMSNAEEVPKGNIYKREQGSDYTNIHDIETTIFGDYITGGLNGYFYDYPVDDTSSLFSPYASNEWRDPTDPDSEARPLLYHAAKQHSRMFSVAHDLISGEIDITNFDPLAIFVDCNNKRYSLVSATIDTLRCVANVDIEEIAYMNNIGRDYIYSYFGEGEQGVKSVGGIASGTGSGGSGGGLTNKQIDILNEVADMAHTHENKVVLDKIKALLTFTDSTVPSDENIMSSLRVLAEILANNEELKEIFLSKVEEDTAAELITFLKGIIAGGTSEFAEMIVSGKITAKDIDVNDNLKTSILQVLVSATLQDAILKGQFNSESFVSGFLGEGFRLSKINDRWTLELDDLIIRKTMQVYELIVQRIRYQGGQVLHSPAGGKITAVTNGGSYWRVEHDSPDDFITNDQVQCQNFKVGSAAQNPDGSTTFEGVSVKRYWRLVTSYGRGWFNLSKTDMEAGSAEPEVGDDIVVLGNRTDATRQNAYMIVSTGANSPYTAHLAGINSYSTAGKEVVREGNLSGIVDEVFGQLSGYGLYGQNVYLKGRLAVQSGSTSVRVPADKGAWTAGTYYYYDRVSYNGSLWLCVAQPSTTAAPSDGSPAWEKQVDKGTDGKGISDTQVRYQVSSSGTVVPTGTWLTSVPSLSAGQFLWTRTITTYTDSTSTTSYSVSKYGETGASGKGISSTVITYQAGTSGTVIPTGTWTSSIPSVAENQFLWTRTVITYTDSTTSTSYSVGKMGAKGDTGEELSSGKMLYKDPTFKSGNNGTNLYNNGSAAITYTRITKPSDAPTDSTHIMRFTYTSGSPSPGFGGFWFGNLSRANAVFVTKIIAKIPEGKTINWSSNAYGTGGTQKWLTSTAGTGKYDTYLCKVICGASGTFSGTNYFYFTGGSGAFDVDIAFATVYDMTVYDDTYDKKITEYDFEFYAEAGSMKSVQARATSLENEQTGIKTRLSTAETAIQQTPGQIDLIATQKVNNSQTTTRNYLRSSRLNNLTGWSAVGGTPSLVTDAKFGTVVQWQRTSGSGEYQKQFTVVEKNSLANTDLVYFVLAKRVSETGGFNYGGWPDTNINLVTGNQIDYGDGWVLYWRTIKSGSTIGSAFGINSITGTWQFCYCGVSLGNKFGGWQPAQEDVQSDYEGKISVAANEINITVNNLKDDLDQTGIKLTTKKIIATAQTFEFRGTGGQTGKTQVRVDGTLYAIDGRFEGTVYATDGEFTGTVNATSGIFNNVTIASGVIGKWNIDQWGLSTSAYGSDGGRIEIVPSGTRFLKINSETESLMVIRADGATGIRIYTQSSSGTGISIAAQTGATAISSYGSHDFNARNTEVLTFNGLMRFGIMTSSVSRGTNNIITLPLASHSILALNQTGSGSDARIYRIINYGSALPYSGQTLIIMNVSSNRMYFDPNISNSHFKTQQQYTFDLDVGATVSIVYYNGFWWFPMDKGQ